MQFNEYFKINHKNEVESCCNKRVIGAFFGF